MNSNQTKNLNELLDRKKTLLKHIELTKSKDEFDRLSIELDEINYLIEDLPLD